MLRARAVTITITIHHPSSSPFPVTINIAIAALARRRFSGPARFNFHVGALEWRHTRNDRELLDLLASELTTIFGVECAFTFDHDLL